LEVLNEIPSNTVLVQSFCVYYMCHAAAPSKVPL